MSGSAAALSRGRACLIPLPLSLRVSRAKPCLVASASHLRCFERVHVQTRSHLSPPIAIRDTHGDYFYWRVAPTIASRLLAGSLCLHIFETKPSGDVHGEDVASVRACGRECAWHGSVCNERRAGPVASFRDRYLTAMLTAMHAITPRPVSLPPKTDLRYQTCMRSSPSRALSLFSTSTSTSPSPSPIAMRAERRDPAHINGIWQKKQRIYMDGC